MSYDVAVVGAGILGLAHALAAARLGKRVVVIERDAQANGASIRNFGFVTVNGQQAGDCWGMARRSRDVWAEVAPKAGIEILHPGMLVTARRPEAEAVIDAFLATDMAADCRRLTRAEALDLAPVSEAVTAALHSPLEFRVESKTAIPKLAAWLAEAHHVDFRWLTEVHAVETPRIHTSAGIIEAETVILCPGDDYSGPFADRLAAYGLTRCKLQMLRVMPTRRPALGAAVMSDLGLARYLGYAELPEAQALKTLLDAEQPTHRSNGVHLIVVQSADGSLVVGDSHHYADTPDPFSSTLVDQLMLGEMEAALDLGPYAVTERWLGTYASATGKDSGRWRLTDAPDEATRLCIVTAGCGASTSFAIGEETISALFA
ncbi:TIGR03364 family FAD-dependent oxidoreductase [Albimonas pacifica]|uniref:FAD dependent oxidoreductase TIGR03364 n=1 Tax=Albimonas pacifica TaxID=1114924 RepID=A0A1I3ECQ4_9RHOB|nr:TIGR03364 family FAD-dependent oxidoreductase [Albimonas pacifica]SFH96725.1 FAD dependent oxidoreductase TIGR03364 [Albimonas pacifica]